MNRELVTLKSSVKRLKPASHSFDATRLKVHPFTDKFAPVDKEQVQKLAEDILANGLQETLLVTYDRTTLIDGRARLRACGIVGVAPRYTTLPEGTSEAEILRFIVQANVKTRDLSPGQLAMLGHDIATEIENFPEEDLVNYPPIRPYDNNTPRTVAAALVGVSSKTLWQAKMITDHHPELEERVRSGETRLNTAYELVMSDRGLRDEPKRANNLPSHLPTTPPHPRDNTRRAVEARRGWLKHLASQKLSSAEIAERLSISDSHVRKLARQYNVELPGDAWSYKRRKPNLDVNRIAQVVADDLMAMEDSFPRIRENLDQLDPDKVDEWARIYHKAYRQLRKLSESLGYRAPTKRTNVNNDDSA